MHTLLGVASLRAIEHEAASGLPPRTLMMRAADAVVRQALRLGEGPFLIFAGPGNNGGDALEAAALLAQAHRQVEVVMLGEPEALPADAAVSWQHCLQAGVAVTRSVPARIAAPVVIDGLFGIGLVRALSGLYAEAIQRINTSGAQVLAIDLPSGIDADTGAVVGSPNGCAVRAQTTLTFIGDKPGLHTSDGIDCAGTVIVDALGIAPEILHAHSADAGALNGPGHFMHALQPRARNTHKGSFGNVAIVGGNVGMTGAVHLAARAALLAGAGRVFVHPLAERQPFDPAFPELMIRRVEDLDCSHVVVAGPGLGQDTTARAVLGQALDAAPRLVLDADALNRIGSDKPLADLLAARCRRPGLDTLLTPHPLEAARLLGVRNEDIARDRIGATHRLVERFGASVVLKGAGSIVMATDGRWFINPTGNPGLASAGTGDVLAGVLGALLAWCTDAFAALQAAVWFHGAAADALVARGIGPIGLRAGELPEEIRRLLNAHITPPAR